MFETLRDIKEGKASKSSVVLEGTRATEGFVLDITVAVYFVSSTLVVMWGLHGRLFLFSYNRKKL